MAANTKELREKRAKLIADARKLNEEHKGELPSEKQAEFDRMMDEADKIKAQFERMERLEGAEKELGEPAKNPLPKEDPNTRPQERASSNKDLGTIPIRVGTRKGQAVYEDHPVGKRGTKEYREAFAGALRGDKLSPERMANLQSDSDPAGGYLLSSEQFAAGLLQEVDDILYVLRYATIHTVPEATSLGIRKRTAKMSVFNWSSELEVKGPDTALMFGKKVLTPHHLTGSIRVSRDLLRRSMLGVETIVRSEMARDSAEVMEQAFLTGDGAAKPLGVFVASTDGISTARDVSADNTATTITADNLRNVKYHLKAQYRLPTGERGGARWLFHRDAIKMISKLKDLNDQYLWQPGMREGDPDLLLGLPVDESERAPAVFTASKYVGLLAQWRYYEVAFALAIEIQRLEELYAATNEVGFIGRLKVDGMPTLEEAFSRVQLST